MRLRIGVTALALLAGAAAASAQEIDYLDVLLGTRPRGYIAAIGARERKLKPENPRAAFEWRLETMKDDKGKIPPGVFHRANVHRRNNLKAPKPKGKSLSTQAASLFPFSWVSRGPQNVGGRTLALLVHPTNNQLLFAGAASGGIWKSTNGGATWTPINDFMANLFIGALAFDPLNPNTMYAGTGERLYDQVVRNSGIFKSTDGGNTWFQLPATAFWLDVQTIAPQPASSNTLLAATGGGIFRTTDGGASWSLSSVPSLSMAQGVAFDPSNGNRAVAAVLRSDGKVQPYFSTDGGLTFNPAGGAQLSGDDIAVAYAPSQPSTVYAILGGLTSQVWRSTNNGASYTLMTSGSNIGCIDRRCTIWVAPNDPNVVVTGGLHLYRSTNGGSSFTLISAGGALTNDPHPDQHCTAHDPFYNGVSNRTVYFCTDGGVWRTSDVLAAAPGSTWTPLTATYQTVQFYGGAGHAAGAGLYLGGTQDNGNLFTTNVTTNATLALSADGGFVEIDPTHLDTWYMETQWLKIYRTLEAGANVAPMWPPESQMNFIAPFILDPNNPNTLYAGGYQLWRTTNATAPSPSWSSVRAGTSANISAIAVAPGNANIVYVGLNDGSVQKTTNGTAGSPTWTDVDNNTSTNPLPDRYITRIYCDPGDTNTIYVALGGFDFNPLWKSTNGGATFISASGSGATSLPPAPVRGITRHPRNAQRLYVGTDVGIYESEDGGLTWLTSEAGPSDVVVDELRFVIGTETLLAATHGRGFWTADVSSVPTLAPSGLVAVAPGTTSVNLSWTGVVGATSYQILRSSDGAPFSVITSVATTSHTDSSVVAGKTYLYRVKAVVNGAPTDPSNLDLATTIVFTDDGQLAGKVVAALHLQEVRSAVNAVRAAAGLGALSFTNPAVPGSPVQANDITALRTGLVAAYNQLALSPPGFAETLVPGTTLIKASHWQEVRQAVK